MKKNKFIYLILFLLITSQLVGQEVEWEVNMFGFADNREYKCSVQIPQSIMGARIAPEIGIGWENHHHIRVGANILQEFGTNLFVNKADYIAYYQYDWKPFHFYFGSFDRKKAYENFPNAFFYDSLNYFRPNIHGLFGEYKKEKNNMSIFLDWTSRQTNTRREAFIMGGSGIFRKNILYGEFQYYMYHHAGKAIEDPLDHVHDNGLLHLALGLDLSEKTFFDTLFVNVGLLQAQERRRGDPGTWETPKGTLIEANIEWQGLGIKNSFYTGDGLMVFYKTAYNVEDLYWGDPFYQSKMYNRTDLYINLIHSNRVKAKFDYSLHFLENKISHQQQFFVLININNNKQADTQKTKKYIWTQWIH